MLRECHRVLKPAGRIAGYVIHTPVGLNQCDMVTAGELGPPDVAAAISIADLAESAGFSVVRQEDVTSEFRIICKSILRARSELEEALRAEEGPEAFEEEQRKKHDMLLGIDRRLLLRCLIVAEKV